MGTDNLEKVLQRLAVTDKITLAIEKAPEGKEACGYEFEDTVYWSARELVDAE